MSYIIYSTDSEEHLINIGEISQPQWDLFDEQDIIEDTNAMNDYLDQQELDMDWDGE